MKAVRWEQQKGHCGWRGTEASTGPGESGWGASVRMVHRAEPTKFVTKWVKGERRKGDS